MKEAMKSWAAPTVPLALGLGILLGVIIASGLHFDGDDSARFLGGILGSLIAVSGAVALYYFKERHDTGKIRERVRFSLKKLEELCEVARGEIKAESDMNFTMLIVLGDYYKRAAEFIGHYQFDDYMVAECYYSLTKFGGKTLSEGGLVRPKSPNKQQLMAEVDYYQFHVNNALSAMQGKPSRDNNSIVDEGFSRLQTESSRK